MRVTKHHGLHNDFLIHLVEGEETTASDPGLARAICDRRTGIGADGLIVATGLGAADAAASGAPDAVMALFNADGSRAEISGNGLRCLGQAIVVHRGLADPLTLQIQTDAGLRGLRVEPTTDPRTHLVRVEMGTARTIGDPPGAIAQRVPSKALLVDLGNPHVVVLVDDPGMVDAEASDLGDLVPGGANVEFIAGVDDATIALRVNERGVGETPACGSGACAAALAAAEWGLTSEPVVTVRMPGGDASVSLGEPLVLGGPAVHIATLDYHGA